MHLKDWQKESGLTDQELADALGVSRVQVFRYKLQGVIPRPKVLAKIAAISKGRVLPQDFYELHKQD